MGDIADMHIEAYEDGLDPNEMDGNDWAEFYGDDEEYEITPDEIGCSARMMLCHFDDLQDQDNLDTSCDGRATALLNLMPEFGQESARKLVGHLMKLSRVANAAGDKDREDV